MCVGTDRPTGDDLRPFARCGEKGGGTFMQELNRQMMALPELRELEEIIRFGQRRSVA